MKTLLRRGRLPVPESITWVRRRRAELAKHIASVQAQLKDDTRILRFRVLADYDAWKDSARRALALYREEDEQWAEWLSREERQVERLLEEACAVLRGLARDGVPLEPHEQTVVDRAQGYLDHPNKTGTIHYHERRMKCRRRPSRGVRRATFSIR